jgi:large subunit ribosomal protein L21
MFAVIKTGGKQYLVREGDVIEIEKKSAQVGDKIVFDEVLLLADEKTTKIGTPLVKGAKVEAEVLEQLKGPKIKVIKFKRKVRYHRKRGHRQSYTKVKITKISL